MSLENIHSRSFTYFFLLFSCHFPSALRSGERQDRTAFAIQNTLREIRHYQLQEGEDADNTKPDSVSSTSNKRNYSHPSTAGESININAVQSIHPQSLGPLPDSLRLPLVSMGLVDVCEPFWSSMYEVICHKIISLVYIYTHTYI